MGKTFHHDMMARLDRETYNGRTVPAETHYAMRQALRKANMRGNPLMSERELAKATFAELCK